MRALLFTVLVSFNLVACVTGDHEAEDMDMPIGEITAAQADGTVDLDDVADEDARLRPDREIDAPANAIEQAPSAKQQTATVDGSQPAIEPVLEKRPVRERDVPETDGQLEQDGQLPKLVEDTALETLTDEELAQLEQDRLHGKQIDADLPAFRN